MSDDIILSNLVRRANYFAGRSISSATKRAYETDWKNFNAFCIEHDLGNLPASTTTVAMYLTDQADKEIAVSTIVRRCTSITAIHRAAGHPTPIKSDEVHRVLSGIKRECGKPQQKAKPILWPTLCKLVLKCDSTMMGLRDEAILLLCWCSAMRRSELVALNIGDVEWVDEGIILTVRRSKTDQEGSGEYIAIPKSNGPVSPVASLKRWLERRADPISQLSPDEPLFSKIGVSGRGKWFAKTGRRLTARMISEIVKHYSKLCGYDPLMYSAHSLRRGFATTAGAAGIPERIISRHTRHKSIVTLRGYIEDGSIWSENPLPAIYSSSSSSSSGEQNR